MLDIEKYLLEEFKRSDLKLQKLDDIQLSLIKFYFTTIFSLGTIIITLYKYGVFKQTDIIVPYFLLLPLLSFGFVIYYSLKKILIEYDYLERTRNEISEIFIWGEIKSKYQLFRSPLTPFYSFISLIVAINLFAFIYLAFPYFRLTALRTIILILVAIALTGIISSIILVSLNTARKKARDARRLADIKLLQVALELYYEDNKKYPVVKNIKELSKYLSPRYIRETPIDPLDKDGFHYNYEGIDGIDYSLKYVLEEGGEKSIASNMPKN